MTIPILFRRRLVNAINASGSNVVYVYGPAGFGKSTLARQWADLQERPTAWFEGFATNDARELFTLLLETLSETIPSLKAKIEKLIVPSSLSEKTINQLIEILKSDRTAFNLIIDNAELIRESHNEFSRLLVSLLPVNIKLVLLTSSSPRSSFVTDYGFERFSLVTAEDLAFSEDEFLQLVKALNLELRDSDALELYRLTEGWPAAVQVVLSEIEGLKNVKDLISTIRAEGKKQFTNIARRILADLNSENYQLLASLALLEEIDAAAVSAISGDFDGVRKLTVLSQESALINQTGATPPSFRLNPIIRSSLLEDFQRDPAFTQKSERVLEHLTSNGDVKAAVKVLLELGSVKRLSEFIQDPKVSQAIDASIQESVARGAAQDLRDWLPVTRWLPGLGDVAREVLSFYAEILSGDFALAESHLYVMRDAVNALDEKKKDSWKVDLLAMESMSKYATGRLRESFDLAVAAFEAAQETKEIRRHHQITYLQLALWSAVICDDDEKVRKIKEIIESDFIKDSLQHRNSIVHSMRSLMAAHEGRFTETRNVLLLPITSSAPRGYKGFFGSYGVKMAESMLLNEAGDVQGSLKVLSEALDGAKKSKNFPMSIALLGRISYIQILLGDRDLALACIEEARNTISQNLLSEELHDCVDIWETRVRYLLKDYDRAQELMKRSNTSYLMRAFEAAININTNPSKALEMIEKFDLQNPRQQLTYHLFRAHIYADRPSVQLAEVKKAVDIGAKHGYFNHFLTQRSNVIQQYISLAAESPTAFNERLARAAGEKLNEMMLGSQQGEEPLTRREADILRHLATGLPLKEIAQNLNISKNTIKTHLRNLYRKLGATDREDAVTKGKKLLKV